MAKATARCTCKDCGQEFVKEKKCQNRTDANNWEAYAERTYDLCPKCWGKQQREAEKAKGLCMTVVFDSPSVDVKGVPSVVMVFYGDTYPHKEQLKELGARWTDDYPAEVSMPNYMVGHAYHLKTWVIRVDHDDPDAVNALLDEVEALGCTVALPSAYEEETWFEAYDKLKSELGNG